MHLSTYALVYLFLFIASLRFAQIGTFHHQHSFCLSCVETFFVLMLLLTVIISPVMLIKPFWVINQNITTALFDFFRYQPIYPT